MSKSPAANPPIVPSAKQSGFPIRTAFFIEALANLFTLPLITHTRETLSLLLLNPSHINPASILFARLFGGIVVGGLTSALLFGTTNTRNGVETRRPTYVMLGMGEVVLIPMVVGEWMKNGTKDAAISKLVAGMSIVFLLPTLLWRVYVLVVRPEWLGRYDELVSERSGGEVAKTDVRDGKR